MNILKGTVFFCLLILASCLKPYDPPVLEDTPEFLVVDAFADLASGETTVSLSRTVALASTDFSKSETGASVTLEDEIGTSYPLPEVEDGVYRTSGLILDLQKKYRISVQTTENKTYQSDYVELRNTPPIDSVTWALEENGIEVRVNTHDGTGSSRYYRWNYIETWEYTSYHTLTNRLVDGEFIAVPPEESKHTCWRSQHSSNILIKATNRQSEDIIRNFPLTFVPARTLKLSVKYSILVQQQVIPEEAYNYWLNLQRITESLGGLFDPQPSQISGNIHCTSHPEEIVVGYFSGSVITEKRLFVPSKELPSNITSFTYPPCPFDTVKFENPFNPTGSSDRVVSLYSVTGNVPPLLGYFVTSPPCIDCELFGSGVAIKPDFWDE